jgi:hypothetical protein
LLICVGCLSSDAEGVLELFVGHAQRVGRLLVGEAAAGGGLGGGFVAAVELLQVAKAPLLVFERAVRRELKTWWRRRRKMRRRVGARAESTHKRTLDSAKLRKIER